MCQAHWVCVPDPGPTAELDGALGVVLLVSTMALLWLATRPDGHVLAVWYAGVPGSMGIRWARLKV